MRDKVELSVVIPVYQAEACLQELYKRLTESLRRIGHDYEIVFVEDSGRDNSWDIIEAICNSDSKVKGIKLSRNFGQHFAISAGLDHAFGNWVVVMDCDLQDQPEEIEKLYKKALEGYDIVFAHRHERQDNIFRKLSSKIFSLIYNYLGDIQVDNSTANFSVASQKVIECIRRFKERNRAYPIFLKHVGFKTGFVDVDHAPRFAGESSYTLSTLIDFAIQCIVSQSNKPLKISIKFGFFLSVISMLYGAYIIMRYAFFSIAVPGWTSIIVLISFFSGLIFANLGILGLYLGKVFDEVKQRPLYYVEKTRNIDLIPYG
ncbi:MAG: glycosyltransferase family 2 protein [Smithella sp.]|jgi:dolichol-phosphate mannosyltransferase